jgi:micrococcal nuclease
MRAWLTAVLLLLGSALAQAEPFPATVIAVLDGDTVLVLRHCTAPGCRHDPPLRIRLADIDAPEKDQPGGLQSKAALSAMVLRREVEVDGRAVDKYGRLVAQLTVDGRNVDEEQVRLGMAWEYSDYHRDRRYVRLQDEARHARRGLWADPHPIAPWEWRRQHAAGPPPAPHTPVTSQPPSQPFTCAGKRYCGQMRSCAEAYFYLTRCGVHALDGDGNGVPCEALCGNGGSHVPDHTR